MSQVFNIQAERFVNANCSTPVDMDDFDVHEEHTNVIKAAHSSMLVLMAKPYCRCSPFKVKIATIRKNGNN